MAFWVLLIGIRRLGLLGLHSVWDLAGLSVQDGTCCAFGNLAVFSFRKEFGRIHQALPPVLPVRMSGCCKQLRRPRPLRAGQCTSWAPRPAFFLPQRNIIILFSPILISLRCDRDSVVVVRSCHATVNSDLSAETH